MQGKNAEAMKTSTKTTQEQRKVSLSSLNQSPTPHLKILLPVDNKIPNYPNVTQLLKRNNSELVSIYVQKTQHV